nr:odorant-binding protein 56a [Drosophila melanogaster]ABW77764.1 odorant-binding protein 56a [Drosophila melanogaster]ABW77765.1 odorant-binding protein 56a [Drosophila melanogaster]ABW77768.1 odorant-binding protein 56a [Drosophila melanogaster]ABW77769.1 odorant-binding protein 56a [Drosophila melanogaster]
MNSYFVIALSALFVTLAVGSSLNLSDEQKDLAKQHREQCAEEVKLTEEEKAKVNAKDFNNPTENIKCFANCFFEKVGTLKDGELQESMVLEKLGALIGEEKTKAALEKCRTIKGENKCDTASKLYDCFESFKPAPEAKA